MKREHLQLAIVAICVLAVVAVVVLRLSRDSGLNEDPEVALNSWQEAFNNQDADYLWRRLDSNAVAMLSLERNQFRELMSRTVFRPGSELTMSHSGIFKRNRANKYTIDVLYANDSGLLWDDFIELVRTHDGWQVSFPTQALLASAMAAHGTGEADSYDWMSRTTRMDMARALREDLGIYTELGIQGLPVGVGGGVELKTLEEHIYSFEADLVGLRP